MKSRTLLLSLSAVLVPLFVLAAGCLSPQPADGAIKCNPEGNACPDNYNCLQGLCYHAGHSNDAAAGDTANCDQYCGCINLACPDTPGTFKDETSCLDTCRKLAPDALGCRLYHCTAAIQLPAIHCPHALGQAVCM